jgi:hypothetical protein
VGLAQLVLGRAQLGEPAGVVGRVGQQLGAVGEQAAALLEPGRGAAPSLDALAQRRAGLRVVFGRRAQLLRQLLVGHRLGGVDVGLAGLLLELEEARERGDDLGVRRR